MKHHICIPIEKALQMLAQGKSVLTGNPLDQFHALIEAKEQGKKYYCGCDNVDSNGMCKGHEE